MKRNVLVHNSWNIGDSLVLVKEGSHQFHFVPPKDGEVYVKINLLPGYPSQNSFTRSKFLE